MSVLQAIREKCVDCCGGATSEVRLCPCNDCALHPYRMGTNPLRKKREMTDEQKAALAVRLAKGRSKKERLGVAQ